MTTELRCIASEEVKKKCQLVSVGSLGWADIENNIIYVVESDEGLKVTMEVLLHEMRHITDGPHPWPEEL